MLVLMSLRNRHRSFRALDDVKALVAVDGVDQLALVDEDVIGRGALQSGSRLRDVPAGFLRRRRIADIDHAKAAREPSAEQRVTGNAFLELMRAETRGRPAKGRGGFLQMEHRHGL